MNRSGNHVLAAARLSINNHVGISLGSFHDEVVHPVHGFALADDSAHPLGAVHAHLQPLIFLLERDFRELLTAHVHEQSLEINGGSVFIVNGFPLIPYPFARAVRQPEPVHLLIRRMGDNTVIDRFAHALQIRGMGHPFQGVPGIFNHIFFRNTQQILTSAADILQCHAVITVHPLARINTAAVNHAGEPVDKPVYPGPDTFIFLICGPQHTHPPEKPSLFPCSG